MKKLFLLLLLTFTLSAKTITPNEVYSQVSLITDEVHFLLNYYGIKHENNEITKHPKVSTKLKPRNVWQMTYEIMVKINILREDNNLPVIEPVNMSPVLNLNPDMVYEQTQRILTELKIFEIRMGIKAPIFEKKIFKGKTSLDVYNALTHVSKNIDELNKGTVTPSFVFAEQMRVYEDITLLLERLKIEDKSIPSAKKLGSVPENAFDESLKLLEKIKQLQIISGINFVDFSEFKKGNESPSDVFTITQMILAELQTLKAYVGEDTITKAAIRYNTKTPSEVRQLVSWNLRKLNLIHSLNKGN
ncbi:MAG: hypothetical protein GQ570_08760 [Helicobacteraceae bacterium]|nr:hypothetical protein [Helicobacteraceae bacterium]